MEMVDKPLRSAGSVLVDARYALRMTQREIGEAVGVSQRTAVRWDAGQAVPGKHNWIKLAELLAPVDLALAEEAAAHADETLASLGLAPSPLPPPLHQPPPPGASATPSTRATASSPSAAAPAAVAPEHLVDAVVCAVAELMDTSPRPLRPLLYAAFKKAREVGLSVEAAEKALAPAAPAVVADALRDRPAK